jgi:hypothetical protein
MTKILPVSSPLDVFIATDTERKILDIFTAKVADMSPRKRKNATLHAVDLLRGNSAPRLQDALAEALFSVERQEGGN